MKVPELFLHSNFIVIDNEGNKHIKRDNSIIGVSEMQSYLEHRYGIKASRSTIWACKKEFTPKTFPKGRTKEWYLAFFNWALNYHPSERMSEYFDSEPDKEKYFKENPFVDFHIRLEK